MSKKEEKKVKKVKNKEKVDTGEIKPKWKVWMTIVSVILGIGIIAGATLLGVYLARGGQTGETPVYPSEITFVQNDSYLELYNNGQLEVTDNFTLTITSTDTEAVVNQRSVNLSLDGNERHSADGKITFNDVVRVPSVVQLNTPFTVELRKKPLQDENDKKVDWIAGGIATITARSAYSQSQASAISVKVAVDVPVYSTEAIILNEDGNPAEKIVIGETFTIQTKFIPAKSEYMYSDDVNSEQGNITSENVRKKLAFYQPSSDNVSSDNVMPVYDTSTTMHFVAGDDIVDGVQLNAYVFKDAKSQFDAEQNLIKDGQTGEGYYTQMVNILSSSQDSTLLTSTRIDIGTADVSAFNISLANSFDIIQNNTTRIYVSNQVSGSINVGAYVQDSNLVAVPSMLSNVLLSFSYTDKQGQTKDPTLGDDAFLQVSGGDVVKIDGQTYYRPYSEGLSNKGHSYWDILSSQVATIEVRIGLLIELENGEIGLYQSNGAPLLFESTMNVTEHTEQNVYWSGIESLDIMLDYLDDGSIDSQTEDLKQYMYVPEQNIYKEPKYLFAYFGEDVDTSTVISILGNGGFNSERSGLYSVGLEELNLYCIERTSLTVYNTGLFDLYFATIMVQDGVPVVSENGLYRIARMSEAISVDVKKELSQDSVTGATMSMGQFVVNEDDKMYYIDLGNNGTFSISFIVNRDSVEVFSEQLGSMTLTIYNSYNQVISTITQSVSEGNFTLVRSDFSINQEEGYGVFTFELQLNPTTTIDTQNDDLGVIINSFTLTYNTHNIVWDGGNGFIVSDLLENQTVMIYDPIAQSITLEYDPSYQTYLTGASEITVNQTLDAESGETVLNISLGETPIVAQDGQSALTALFNLFFGENFANIVITDQVGRTDTLAGEWSFRLLEGSSQVVAVQGQTIQFRNGNGNTVVIDIVSLDENVETGSADDVIKMKFNVTSTGITDVFFNSNLDPDSSINEGTNEEESESTISVAMSKYGAYNNTIILANQVRLEVNGVTFNKIQFSLSNSYLENLGSAIVDLFGTDGMLTVYNNTQPIQTGTNASIIRSNLQGKVITSIRINKNFYQSRSVQLTISDEANSGVVNITLNMTILPNIAISGATTYGSTTDSSRFIYATAKEGDSEGTQISNIVTNNNNNEGTPASFGSLYTVGTYYIVSESGQYVLDTRYTDRAVGEMVVDVEDNATNATIRFYDFWDTEYKQFSVVFRPEGNNQYAISYTLTFIILRDLDLNNLATGTDTFYILNTGETPQWTSFIQYTRHDRSPIEEIDFSGEFEDYLYIESEGNVSLLDNSAFLFEYNTTSYATKLSLMFDGKELGSVDVYIKLYNTGDQTIYEYIASQIQISKENVPYNPTTQIVDGVEYIMLVYDSTSYTLLSSRLDSSYFNGGYTMHIRNIDTANTTYYRVGADGNTFTLTSQNQLLGGLGNENSYLVLYFNQGNETGSSNAKAIMHVPLINSAIGYNFVKYNSGVEDNLTLKTALTDPSELLKQGIYNEITAGQATQIMNDAQYYSNSTDEIGLIRPIRDGGSSYSVTTTITYYPTVTDGTNLTNESIVKAIDSNEGYLDLNHLTNDTLYENFYLGLSYNINYNGRYQIFYYLLKITPDINVEASTYAYTSYGEEGEEHIRVDQNSRQTFDLDKIYDETTLNEGFSRFNVSKILSKDIDILVVDVRSSSEVSLAFKVSGSYTTADGGDTFTDQMVILDDITSDCAIDIRNIAGSYLYLQLLEILKVGVVNIESVELIVRSGSCYIYDGSSLSSLVFNNDGICENSSAVAEFIEDQDTLGTSSVNRAIFANLVSTNVIESVKVGGQDPYTFPKQWAEDITFYNVNGNVIEGSTFNYVVKTSERIEIVIKRTYESDTSLEQKYKRSIYGAEQYYTIVLNDESNSSYNARFTLGDKVQSVYNGVYTWELENADTADNPREQTLTVQLVSNSTAGQETTTGTVVPDLLQIKLVDGNEDVDFKSYTYNTHSYIDDNGLEPYHFKLTLKDYISEDTTIEFSVYTQYGYLATLRINIKANASYARKKTEGDNPVEVASTLVGGKNIDFSSVYDIELDNTATTDYTVTAVMGSANNSDHRFVKIDDNQFVVADIVSDKTVTFKYTITFLDAKNEPTDKKFTFTDTLTFKRNISVQAITGASSLAGVDDYNLITKSNRNHLYINSIDGDPAVETARTKLTYSASSTSSAVDISEGIFKYPTSTSVTIKDISSEMQSVSINITMHFEFIASTEENNPTESITFTASNEEDEPTESITFTYTFNVYKAVTVDTNYPMPDGKTELEIEYFENGSVINNALSDFILSNPIYNEDTTRFTAYQNNLNTDTNVTVQGSQITEGLTADKIRVVIQEIQNATIWQYSTSGIGDTQYYASNAIEEEDLDQGLYLRRGTYSQTNDTDGDKTDQNDYVTSGERSVIIFEITYREATTTYTIELLDSVFTIPAIYTKYATSGVINNEDEDDDTTSTVTQETTTSSTVTHETIYVDKTNTNNIFSGDRMFQVQISNNLLTDDTYYIVFKGIRQSGNDESEVGSGSETNTLTEGDTETDGGSGTDVNSESYYASYPQYISLQDQGSRQYLDLGYSMYDLEYVGTFKASDIENAGIGFGENGVMTKTARTTNESGTVTTSTVNITADDLESITNVDENNALFTTKQLVSRIQLYYGGNKVDYDYFKKNIEDHSVSATSSPEGETDEINKIKLLQPIESISVENGVSQVVITNGNENLIYKSTTGYTEPLSTEYYFMPKIDIEVEEAFTVNNYTEVTVNRTYPSIVQQLGIKHPTNDSYVSASDFGEGKATIQFKIIYYRMGDNNTGYKENVPEESVQNSLEAFMTLNGIDEFKHYATPDENNPDQGTNEYIAYSPKRNASGAIYDASVMPLGAQVNGDFVLSKITYSSTGGYSETFYVVYKVMPDYIVSFSGSTENYTISTDQTGNSVISNVNNPFSVYSVTSDGKYSPFILTSTDSTEGELSIKHRYGNNTSTEYSTSNFDITLTLDQPVSGRMINDSENFDQKFAYTYKYTPQDSTEEIEKVNDDLDNWILSGSTYTYNGKPSAITFSAVKEVIFGNQYYMIEGEDVYGYKYQFYFCLKSQYTQPSIASTGQNPVLKELDYFDIGSIYTMLNIEYNAGSGESNPGSYAITTNNVSPVSSAEVPLINIANVGTYFFDRDYTESTIDGNGPTNNQYLQANGSDGYKPITGDNPRTTVVETDYSEVDMWQTEPRKYFNSPNFKYVTVDSATFYSINEEDNTAGKELGNADMPKATSYTLAEKRDGTWDSSTTLSYSLGGKNYQITVNTTNNQLSLTITDATASIIQETANKIVEDLKSKLQGGVTVSTPTVASSTDSITLNLTTEATKVQITSGSNEYNLATTTTQNAFFNGLEDKIREPFVSGTVNNEFGSEVQQAIQVPSFAGEVYANSTETDMKLVIRLKYHNGETVEYTDLQTTVTVVREVQIVELDKVVADGEFFALSDVFIVTDGQGTTLGEEKISYLNDTLELLIKAQSTARFNISLTRDNETIVSDVSVSRSNYDSYDKTTYLSISSLLNTSVQSGDTITISNANGNATFYYIYPNNQTQSGEEYTGYRGGSKGILTFTDSDANGILDGEETIEFKIQAITNDYIYVENAQRLSGSNSYYTVDKYYIAQVDKDANSQTDNSLNYRVSHRYYVTGRYYSMSGATTDQIIRKLINSSPDDNAIYTDLTDWTPHVDVDGETQTNPNAVLTLRDADVDNTTVSNGSVKGFDKDYIWFMIDPLGGNGSGNVSINNDYSNRSADDYGRITYESNYSYDQYIEIVFRVVVSGADRDISTLDNGYDVGNVNISYELGSILVGWASNFRPTTSS